MAVQVFGAIVCFACFAVCMASLLRRTSIMAVVGAIFCAAMVGINVAVALGSS